jgi:UDP-N-acetylmuramate--alanine ligase
MNVSGLKRIYFIGIGGIGMSAIARFFKEKGAIVEGYDRTATDLTRMLASEGIEIHYDDDDKLLDKQTELVVYTPAIPADHKELTWYRENGYTVLKRSEVLQLITQELFAITVAGTHGKTTISTMIAYLLRETGFGVNAFLGGVSVNYNSNYWSSSNQVAVIEADEYDRSFLRLLPDIAVLTSMDPDHLDIYGTVGDMEDAFIQYTKNIKPNGTLLLKHGLKRAEDLKVNKTVTYSLQNSAADAYADNVVQKQGGYIFRVVNKFGVLDDVRLNIGGMHNVENAVAAITVAQMLEIDSMQIWEAIARFKGVHRRFEYVVRNEKLVYVDDYAHHPEELSTLIKSVKRLFPDRKCVVVFQPHLFTRTRDLAEGFAHSLDLADEIILLDIYPARELPIEGVTSQLIADKMGNPNHTILSKEGLIEYVRAAPLTMLVTAGAGDIDKLVPELKEILETK